VNEIAELLQPAGVVAGLKATNKRHLLQELAAAAARLTGADERAVLDVLVERERLGTTGVGRGIAIPHAKIDGLPRLVGLFARLETPIDFEAVDDEPVDLVFLLIAPEAAGAEHLKALARVSRLLRDDELCRKLRGTKSADALYAIITSARARAA
jgi:PTS system nitrogen regulatory IIA component